MVRRMSVFRALLIVGLANWAQAAPWDACKAITGAASRACRAGTKSDNALALGKCANLPDRTAVRACRRQAKADSKDALGTCKEQRHLRQAACARLGAAPYDPAIDPADFVAAIDNPFFPLMPGTTFVYEGQTADGFEHVEFAVTTRDWFAQDRDGNVWYFGENTTLVDGGLPVDLSGSWTAGVDGARPGIIMKAHPAIGDFYRQEFLLGEAEDLAEVKSLTDTATVPYGSFDHCLETEESSSLAPGDVEHKFYAAGVGNLLTIDLETGERSELVQIVTE